MIRECLVALASGAIIESLCVFWIHYVEKEVAAKPAAISMLVATAQLAGIGEGIRDWRVGACFVLGYGIGTYFAVKFKSSWRRIEGAH